MLTIPLVVVDRPPTQLLPEIEMLVVEAPPLKVAGPVMVVAPVRVVAPVTPRVDDKVEAPVTASVPVAVRLARVKFPEKRALPWTERVWDGVVVPMPIFSLMTVRVEVPDTAVPVVL